jgi:hypothetical protein
VELSLGGEGELGEVAVADHPAELAFGFDQAEVDLTNAKSCEPEGPQDLIRATLAGDGSPVKQPRDQVLPGRSSGTGAPLIR